MQEWIDEHPTIAVVGALILAVFLFGMFMRRNTNTSSNVSSSDAAKQNSSSNPGYLIGGDEFINYYAPSTTTTNSGANSGQVINTTGGTVILHPPPPEPPHSTPPPHVEPPKVNPPTPRPTSGIRYIVRSGDTLSSIAARYGVTWQKIYSDNKTVIDSTSHAHGDPIPGGAFNNIFPGEVLIIDK